MNNTLHPPIKQIHQRLFGLSDELLNDLANNADSVPNKVKHAALEQADIKQAVEELKQVSEEDISPAETEIPLFIKDLIDRRCAVQSAQFDPMASSGQIVRIDQVKDPKNQLDWQLGAPLVVLLDQPTEENADLWRGWMVSPDTDYADYWDVLLEPCDEPFDPLAGMVQIWNPVHLWIPQASQVIAQISLARLQAIRAVASEFIIAEISDELAKPGFIAPRKTLHDFTVLTGTMLGDQQDPRHQYQHLYFEVAKAVKEPARIALSQLAPGFLTNLVAKLTELRDKLGQPVLLPGSLIPQAMSTGSDASSAQENTFKLEGYGLFITVSEAINDPEMLNVSLQYKAEGELDITLQEDGINTEHHMLSQATTPVILDISKAHNNNLIIKCPGKNTVEIPLNG